MGFPPIRERLRCRSLQLVRCDKFCAIVEKHNCFILDMYEHIYPSIPVHILESEGYWRYILSITDERWAKINLRLRGIISGYLYHHDPAVKVHRNEVARARYRVFM